MTFIDKQRCWHLQLLSMMIVCCGCAGSTSPGNDWVTVQTTATSVAEQEGNSTVPRRMITQAKFIAETSDVDVLSQTLSDQVAHSGGFIASFSEQRNAGEPRGCTWTIRLPTNQFEPFVQWLDKHVTVIGRELSSQDVSEEFVDLEARLKNKQNTEARLANLLEERAGKLDDILGVEREIDRVREEIERLQGRRRFLQDRIALCTVTLSVNTRLEAQIVQAPSFVTRMRETWSASALALIECAQQLALLAVGLSPWLPVLLAIGYVFYRIIRRLTNWFMRTTMGVSARPSSV